MSQNTHIYELSRLEKELFQLELTGSSADVYRGPVKLYAKLMRLAGTTEKGDFPPTEQRIEVHEMFKSMLEDLQEQFAGLVNTDVAGFNEMLKSANLLTIIIPKK